MQHLIERKDLNEAISNTIRIPTLPVGGSVKVRAAMLARIPGT
jgi:hypothetical protein